MKSTTKFLLFLPLFLTLGGCEDFLDEKPFDFVTSSNFFQNKSDAQVAVNGIYSQLQQNNAFYGRRVYILSDVFSDEAKAYGTGERPDLENMTYNSANSEIFNWYAILYQTVNRCNNIVEKIPAVPVNTTFTEAEHNRMIGEARFVRALMYFELVRYFGAVSLVTTATASVEDNKNLPRSPEAEVYKQIIDDLTFAEANLEKEAAIPNTYKGRASSGAATGLLAKVILTRAYLPFGTPDDFKTALAKLNQLINSKEYDLMPTYPEVFDVAKETGKEHLFAIQYDFSPNNVSDLIGYITPTQTSPGVSYGSFVVERPFYDAFPNDDKIRKGWNFYTKFLRPDGTVLVDYGATGRDPFVAKFRDPGRTAAVDRVNYFILRYADILLLQSEAANRVNAADPLKYEGINKVRARVQLPPVAGEPDAEAFEKLVLDERHWELCFEGQRRHDIIRVGKFVAILKAAGKTFVEEKHRYLPIPDVERGLNPNLTQNTGF